MAKQRGFSIKPSDAESGGKLTFPTGSTVKIVECRASTYGDELDRDTLAKMTRRQPIDACLVVVGAVEGREENQTVLLGAGKGEKVVPTKDGEFFDAAPGSSAKGLNDNCAAHIFVASLCNEKHLGKGKALSEDVLDEGYSALEGLVFIANNEKKEGNFEDAGDDKKKSTYTVLIADEIIKLPGKGSAKSKGGDDDEDEKPTKKASKKDDDEDDAPASKKKSKGGDDDDSIPDKAERVVIGLLEDPKFRKGLPKDRAYTAAYTQLKGQEDAKDICALIEDEEWMQNKKRPWGFDADEDKYTSID